MQKLDPECSNNFVKILLLGMLFLSQGLIEMIIKGLNKSISTNGFPYAVNQVSSFERYSNVYKL